MDFLVQIVVWIIMTVRRCLVHEMAHWSNNQKDQRSMMKVLMQYAVCNITSRNIDIADVAMNLTPNQTVVCQTLFSNAILWHN